MFTVKIYDINVVLVNVYAPNLDNEAFFRWLFSMLPDLSSFHLILGEDFNCWLNPHLDLVLLLLSAESKSAKNY